jgi:hypothetical protein
MKWWFYDKREIDTSLTYASMEIVTGAGAEEQSYLWKAILEETHERRKTIDPERFRRADGNRSLDSRTMRESSLCFLRDTGEFVCILQQLFSRVREHNMPTKAVEESDI